VAPVQILSVRIEQPVTPDPTRNRYRVRLACGCTWWEYRAEQDAPLVGEMSYCFAQHTAPNVAPPRERQRAAPLYRSP
jgi:hypothetical protein